MGKTNLKWHKQEMACRIPIIIDANGHERINHICNIELKLGGLIINTDSICVVETDLQGELLNDQVVYQYDQYADTDSVRDSFVILAEGESSCESERYFQIYFNEGTGTGAGNELKPLLTVVDGVMDEGQECYEIITDTTTYYYQKNAGGFSSIVDKDGNDWINYHEKGGPAGHYRGVPNLIYPEGSFHPGATNCLSEILNAGPLRVTIQTETIDHKWKCRWEIYPYYARLTVLKIDHPYWFLYEGTPDGRLNEQEDFILFSTGERKSLADPWDSVVGSRWLAFCGSKSGRCLYFLHHEESQGLDSYWPMQKEMTVFGFGRSDLERFLTKTPACFTMALLERNEFKYVAEHVYSTDGEHQVHIGEIETN